MTQRSCQMDLLNARRSLKIQTSPSMKPGLHGQRTQKVLSSKAKKLQEKRQKMRMALTGAISEFRNQATTYKNSIADDYYKLKVEESNTAFLNGLDTLAEINLADQGVAGAPLFPGMKKIKEILTTKKGKDKKEKNNRELFNPGESVTIDALDGFTFHVLGPPFERDYIFKDGKEGTDVYNKKLNSYESALAATSFLNQGKTDIREKDIPFR